MQPSPSQPSRIDPSVEEVRVAMALNGGVSLAVWMGGCAVELDCARRAHLGVENLEYGDYQPDGASGTATRHLYNGLCRAFGRRLSVDILTGASAGGVNGALLAAAMVSGRRLHPRFVRERWLDLGDLSRLLRDPAEQSPRALMDGDMFHDELLRAFLAVRGESEPAGAAPDEEHPGALAAGELPTAQRHSRRGKLIPDLDVTMTDVVGTGLSFPDDWGDQLLAREHAPRFKFRREGDYTTAALAAAARTSASFPLAFDPWEVKGEAAVRAGLAEPTYGIDGGLLDNAPIRAALELIPFRRTGTRVRRYACYMNADPAQPEPSGEHGQPEVQDVIGYVLSLPRSAPFAGHLYAVREAVNRPLVTQAIVQELLRMDLSALERTAEALLPAYRRRRTARSIEELVPDPAAARAVRDAIPPQGASLPWIPAGDAIEVPEAQRWSWGVRPAQRILYLLLDLLREALHDATGPAASQLLVLRESIEERIERLESIHEVMVARIGPLLAAAADDLTAVDDAAMIAVDRGAEIYRHVTAAAREVLGFREGVREADREGTAAARTAFAALFEPSGEEEAERQPYDPIRVFFRRVLAIEVVRRALSDEAAIDTAQELSFVQLTPSAPTPILAASPLTAPPPPAEAKDKLAGLGLSHFAGFYRRAWRANDFMWGRLDAAARVVDLLLDQPPRVGHDEGMPGWRQRLRERAEILAGTVLGPGASTEQRWLVQEALADYDGNQPPAAEQKLLDTETLTICLTEAFFDEMIAAGPSPAVTALPLTRAVCTRAAQLEVIRDELPVLVEEARTDGERGSSGKPLDLGEGGLRSRIEALRGGEPLPRRLTGEGEAVSDLGLGTIARASRIGISMLDSTPAPLTKALGVLRVPALAVSGVVARERLHRLTAGFGFTAAATYLASRIVTAESADPSFSKLWSPPVLLSLVAALIVATAIAVPALQAAKGIRRPLNVARAAGLAACGGIVAGALALWAEGGGLSLEQVLLCPGAENPPETIVLAALAATAGLAALRLPIFSKAATGWLRLPRDGTGLCLLMTAVSCAVGIASAIPLWGAIDDGWWRSVSVPLALPGAALVAAWLLTPWRRRGPGAKGAGPVTPGPGSSG
jgi:hypothetical protein